MEQLKPPVVIVARTESSLGSVHGANGVELKGRLGSRILRRRLLQAGVFVAVWTVIAIAGSVHCYFSYASLGEPMKPPSVRTVLDGPQPIPTRVSRWFRPR